LRRTRTKYSSEAKNNSATPSGVPEHLDLIARRSLPQELQPSSLLSGTFGASLHERLRRMQKALWRRESKRSKQGNRGNGQQLPSCGRQSRCASCAAAGAVDRSNHPNVTAEVLPKEKR
jgi:hypothetical protein